MTVPLAHCKNEGNHNETLGERRHGWMATGGSETRFTLRVPYRPQMTDPPPVGTLSILLLSRIQMFFSPIDPALPAIKQHPTRKKSDPSEPCFPDRSYKYTFGFVFLPTNLRRGFSYFFSPLFHPTRTQKAHENIKRKNTQTRSTPRALRT